MANGADVTSREQTQAMVDEAIAAFGQVDILVNNAGILRDKTFAKMELDDFWKVVDVHLMGSVNCTKAVWAHMVEREYGRIVMTTSASGVYGNFGQSNYGAAKAGVVGFMNVLAQEGARKNIRVNTLAPTAATRMTEGLIPDEIRIGHGDRTPAGGPDGAQDQEIADRHRDADAGRDGVSVLPARRMFFAGVEGADDRRTAFCLDREHLRTLRTDPAEGFEFVEGLPHADQAGAAAGGIEDGVR